MTPQEALNFLYSAIRQVQATAEVHERLKQAALVLEQAIAPTEVKNKEETGSLPN